MSQYAGIWNAPSAPGWKPTQRLSPPLFEIGTNCPNTLSLRMAHGVTNTTNPTSVHPNDPSSTRHGTRQIAHAMATAGSTSSTCGRTMAAAPVPNAAATARVHTIRPSSIIVTSPTNITAKQAR